MFAGLASSMLANFRVFALDLLGSGNSDPLPGDIDFPALGQNIVDVMDGLGLPNSHIFGLHTGNKLGSLIAARWPDKVRAFVLCGQTHSIVPDLEARNRGIGERAKIQPHDVDEGRQLLIAWAALSQRVTDLWWQTRCLEEKGAAAAVDRAQAMAVDEIQAFQATPSLYRMNFSYDMAADWVNIKVPTLVLEVVTIREDTLYGRQGEIVRDMIPGAQLTTLEATGFKLTLEDQADDLAAIITPFLASVDAEYARRHSG